MPPVSQGVQPSMNLNIWTWSGDRLVLLVTVLTFSQFVTPQLFGATAGQVRWATFTTAYLAAIFAAKVYGDGEHAESTSE